MVEEASPRWRAVVALVFALGLGAVFFLRAPKPASVTGGRHEVSGSAFGTTYSVRYYGAISRAQVRTTVQEVVARVNRSMSTYHSDSELSRLNRRTAVATVTVSEDLWVVLGEARAVHGATGGAFDPTVGPLVEAWGFGPAEAVLPPSRASLERARARVGMNRLELSDEGTRSVTKLRTDVSVDLSAIAKGYAVDRVSSALRELGLSRHIVEIGGEVRAHDHGPDGPWRVGIERPVSSSKRQIAEAVSLRHGALATSGNYRNFVTVDGRTVTHIIDPRSGEPVAHGLGSVTVVHPSCMTADALATALYVLGESAGYAWAEERAVAALFLTERGGELVRRPTTAFAQLFDPEDTSRSSP